MSEKTILRKPNLAEIIPLLQSANLPTEDLHRLDLDHFFGIEKDSNLVGIIGLEPVGRFGLLRSLAVSEGFRNQGIGTELIRKLLSYAKSIGIERLFLLTNGAEEYFSIFGFSKVERNEVPAEISQTEEFSKLCPAHSSVMCRILSE
ncbi:GNAT family N-acetyltransferase [Leptospira yasudae]|uniref:arsenic resistance N-acetyltransferase ArsN2 n=1 Tax=Leptospira yasudae TaxID=2202201 RepID=UPI001083EA94|nr:arsenic resistance N-acetyltransferase ArsN2 [Leptospira yasudae]TGK24226.1 GNAT family N-acetyltransferase [Leptospira yasudae]TGM00838.1 GNAT family N-acetyltransferase [Leptospira yasudae]